MTGLTKSTITAGVVRTAHFSRVNIPLSTPAIQVALWNTAVNVVTQLGEQGEKMIPSSARNVTGDRSAGSAGVCIRITLREAGMSSGMTWRQMLMDLIYHVEELAYRIYQLTEAIKELRAEGGGDE